MSFHSTRSKIPSHRRRALPVMIFIAFGFATKVAAQYPSNPPGGYGPEIQGGAGHTGGAERMGRHGAGGDIPTLELIEGPATPAVMHDTMGLSDELLERYAGRYDDHMAATQPVRDSLRASMKEIRAAFESGDRSVIRERRSEVQRQWKDLSKRDKEFEGGLKDLLSKDQQKRYEKWKEAREKAARERMEKLRR
jgi:hypothetical protein